MAREYVPQTRGVTGPDESFLAELLRRVEGSWNHRLFQQNRNSPLTSLQYLHAFCVVVYGYVTVYVLWKAPREPRNLAFASVTLCSLVWSASLLLVHDPAVSEQQAAIGYNLGAAGWCAFGSVSLWFALGFAGERRMLARRSVQLMLVIPPVLLVLAQWRGLLSESYVHLPWGWGFRW